jgi:precorrin-6B methylase 2
MEVKSSLEEQDQLFPLLFQLDAALPDPVFYSMQSGLMLCSAVNAAVRLDLATHLETPKPLEMLAQETQTHAPSLAILLNALASIGIFKEIDKETHTFAHTERSRLLIPNVPGSMADLVGLWGAPYQWNSWRDLAYTIRTGLPAIQQQEGPDASIWSYLQGHPQESLTFQRGLTAVSSLVIPAILAQYDFSTIRHIVDVGGGHGNLAVTLLGQYPHLQATLFDREMIIEHIRQDAINQLPQDITSRYTLVAGNFFEAVPEGADCYILKNVLMDWSDAEYLQILNSCRQAMNKDTGRILVIESMISETSHFTRFFSLQMAMMMRAARHRTREEHQALFERAGFVITQAYPLGLEQMLLEGRPMEQSEGEQEP